MISIVVMPVGVYCATGTNAKIALSMLSLFILADYMDQVWRQCGSHSEEAH